MKAAGLGPARLCGRAAAGGVGGTLSPAARSGTTGGSQPGQLLFYEAGSQGYESLGVPTCLGTGLT